MNGKGSTQSVFFLDCCEGPIPETSGPADVPGGYVSPRGFSNCLVRNGDSCLYRSSSLRTGFLRRELARSQSGQIKKLRGVFAVFPDATEALNVAFAR
jgi:hypothetical protein